MQGSDLPEYEPPASEIALIKQANEDLQKKLEESEAKVASLESVLTSIQSNVQTHNDEITKL